MSDEPETLEETQARLSRVTAGAARGQASAPQNGTPDPYPAPASTRSPRRRGIIVVVGLVAVVAAGSGAAIYAATSSAAAAHWADYPGTAYRDSDEALNGDSLETVMANGSGAIEQFQQQMTDEFGMQWETIYDETLDRDYNYYGGESMLYFWDTGLLQGKASVNDPAARQAIVDAFQRAATAGGADDFSLWNELLEPGDPFTLEQYGLGEKADQAHWSGNGHDDTNGMVFSLDVLDLTIPVGDTFAGADSFYIDEGDPATIYVTVFASAPALLAEADRAEFIERLKPYAGLPKPEPSD